MRLMLKSQLIESIGSLKENFVDQVNENNIEMLKTYDVIQAGVVMLKVDMLQKLNISVDYVDADGVDLMMKNIFSKLVSKLH